MKSARLFATVAILAMAPQMGATQLLLDDLESRSSGATTEMDRLRDILSSPNTDQAMRATQIVMSEGSIEQKRVALEASLSSTSGAVRRTGMEAYLNAKPLIAFTFDGSNVSAGGVKYSFQDYFTENGTLEENELGRFALRVGDYSPENGCWTWVDEPKLCMFRLTDENVILYLENGTPGVGVIGIDGIVRGNVTIPGSSTVPYTFIVKF